MKGKEEGGGGVIVYIGQSGKDEALGRVVWDSND